MTMSKRQYKSQASSGRIGTTTTNGFGGFVSSHSSVLSYVQEPPNYSAISDSNVVVSFKNLSKKDGTTKARALEELTAFAVSPDVAIDEAFLDAWVRVFPRLSIDNARRVRQLAHNLNGQVCSKSGKRTVRHMPRIVGPWLAGTFDNDRTVSRAASESLALVFPTEAKIQGVRKAFQHSILEYCRDSALHETVKTLSDERVVSSDDAEATYARVVATSLLVLGSLLTELDDDAIDTEIELYEETLNDSKIWEFAHHTDAGVRRAMHRLVQSCLIRRPALIESNARVVSNSYVYKGLHTDQSGSALAFVQALRTLTTYVSQIWTDEYKGKKSAASRLRHFLKQGSQAAPAGFWEAVEQLLRSLPIEVFPTITAEVGELLTAARQGVTRREERLNASAAWSTYFTLADLITSKLEDGEAEKILGAHLLPVVRQYVHPSSETADWSITGARAAWVVSKVTTAKKVIPLIAQDWPALTKQLIEIAKTSQPEQSKDYEKSQRHVGTTGERWADLQRELWDHSGDVLAQTFTSTSSKLLDTCISLLKSRNGKPYGAAAVMEQMLRTCSQRLMEYSHFRNTYTSFAQNDMTTIIFSQSQRHLLHGLYAIVLDQSFNRIFEVLINDIVDATQPEDVKVGALRSAFSPGIPAEAVNVARSAQKLQAFLLRNIRARVDHGATELFAVLVKLDALPAEMTDQVLATLVDTLTTSSEDQSVLSTMAVLTKIDPSVVQSFASQLNGSGERLLPGLVRLEQSENDEIADKASQLSSQLSSILGSTSTNARYSIVRQEVEHISERSLPIDAVLDLANRLRGPERSTEHILDLLPSSEVWLSALREVIERPKLSMALMSPFGGGLCMLTDDSIDQQRFTFDPDGFSRAFRIALYVTKLLAEAEVSQQVIDPDMKIQDLLQLSVLVAEDNVSVLGMNGFWSVQSGLEGESAGLDFVQEARKLLSERWKSTSSEDHARFNWITDGDQNLTCSLSYYISLSRIKVHEHSFELHGYTSAQVSDSETKLKEKSAAKQTLPLIEFLVAHQQPLSGTQGIDRLCNELVADLTDLDISKNENLGLEQLVVLNAILRTQPGIVEVVAKQRLIFLIKNLLSWLNASAPALLKVEVCRAVTDLLPGIQDMYGEHWEQVLSFLLTTWKTIFESAGDAANDEIKVLLLNASLRLFGVLRTLSRSEEPNDDLLDALKDNDGELRESLVNLLVSSKSVKDESNQPLLVTNELLARQLTSLSPKPLQDAQELYPLMYNPSRPIMQAAFDLLHQHIPTAQEQISFDAAIDKKTAQLPDELLSLILEPPSLESLADVSFERMLPLALQGYLYSWRLLFDHFDGSSYKVKNDYIEQLKEGSYLDGLLDFVFDFLGHSTGKPIDISKFDLFNYIPYIEPIPEKDVQWLLSRLYFLALMHLPSLVKSYYLNIRSRQTSSSIESWTAKHISPLLIDASLRSVAEWSEKSSKDDREADSMTIKVGMRSKEIQVGYVVDEQTMAIKVVLPDAYPLASAQVVGVSRVAVKEEKWQSWLRNCQGVITFSNGSIIDGLTAWRKNVTGALKGQSECAICYSIIGGDKQLPTKKCPTCKNMFHASCLLKWFKTSNASTCPLCRNPFNFN